MGGAAAVRGSPAGWPVTRSRGRRRGCGGRGRIRLGGGTVYRECENRWAYGCRAVMASRPRCHTEACRDLGNGDVRRSVREGRDRVAVGPMIPSAASCLEWAAVHGGRNIRAHESPQRAGCSLLGRPGQRASPIDAAPIRAETRRGHPDPCGGFRRHEGESVRPGDERGENQEDGQHDEDCGQGFHGHLRQVECTLVQSERRGWRGEATGISCAGMRIARGCQHLHDTWS